MRKKSTEGGKFGGCAGEPRHIRTPERASSSTSQHSAGRDGPKHITRREEAKDREKKEQLGSLAELLRQFMGLAVSSA